MLRNNLRLIHGHSKLLVTHLVGRPGSSDLLSHFLLHSWPYKVVFKVVLGWHLLLHEVGWRNVTGHVSQNMLVGYLSELAVHYWLGAVLVFVVDFTQGKSIFQKELTVVIWVKRELRFIEHRLSSNLHIEAWVSRWTCMKRILLKKRRCLPWVHTLSSLRINILCSFKHSSSISLPSVRYKHCFGPLLVTGIVGIASKISNVGWHLLCTILHTHRFIHRAFKHNCIVETVTGYNRLVDSCVSRIGWNGLVRLTMVDLVTRHWCIPLLLLAAQAAFDHISSCIQCLRRHLQFSLLLFQNVFDPRSDNRLHLWIWSHVLLRRKHKFVHLRLWSGCWLGLLAHLMLLIYKFRSAWHCITLITGIDQLLIAQNYRIDSSSIVWICTATFKSLDNRRVCNWTNRHTCRLLLVGRSTLPTNNVLHIRNLPLKDITRIARTRIIVHIHARIVRARLKGDACSEIACHCLMFQVGIWLQFWTIRRHEHFGGGLRHFELGRYIW